MEFRGALITEIGFPALDGSSKEPGYITAIAAFPDVCFTPPTSRGFTATDDLWK